MSRIPLLLLFLVAWLAVFAQTQFPVVVDWIGSPVSILPALTIYAALSHSIGMVACFCIVSALSLDSLSANHLGVSLLPLFLCAFATHARQHLILRDQAYARFWLGLGSGLAVPLLTRILLNLGARQPLGDAIGFEWILSGVVNAIACPLCFATFDRLRDLFEYKPIVESSYRADRQIKRGRH
jgi:cell shape-determining protein MreD